MAPGGHQARAWVPQVEEEPSSVLSHRRSVTTGSPPERPPEWCWLELPLSPAPPRAFSFTVFCFWVFFFIKIDKFIYFWLRWVLVAARGLSLVVASGGFSSLRCTGSKPAGFSSYGMQAQ